MSEDVPESLPEPGPKQVAGPTLRATRTHIVVETPSTDPEVDVQRAYFSREKCSQEERDENHQKAFALDLLSGVTGTALSFTGVGMIPGAAIGVAGNAAAENLRDQCRFDDEQKAARVGISDTVGEVASAALNSLIPGSGVAKDFLVMAPNIGMSLVNLHADQMFAGEDAGIETFKSGAGPRRLVPDNPPEMTEHQKGEMRRASEALRHAVITHAQVGQVLATPARAVGTPETTQPGTGLY